MKKNRKRRLARGALAGGTATLATMGLTTCDGGGGGVVDPLPPPWLTCSEANDGGNLTARGVIDSLSLRVDLYDFEHSHAFYDTVSVSNVTGATLDSLNVANGPGASIYLTLDSLAVTQVTFTLKGTWDLKAGPCDFQRTFTVTIDSGNVQVTQRERRFPLEPSRDVRIELVLRDGLHVDLRAAMSGEGVPEWRATAGTLERLGRLGVTWHLPEQPGFYQVELSVDRGVHGIGFDALALEVT